MSAALSLVDLRKNFGPVADHPRRLARHRGGRAARDHRPERRRQIDAVQPRQRPHPAELGRGAPAWAADHRALSVRDQPPRPVAQFSDHQHLSEDVGRGKSALRRALVARLQIRVLDLDRPAARRSRTCGMADGACRPHRAAPCAGGRAELCRAAGAGNRRDDRRRRRGRPARRADGGNEQQRNRTGGRPHPQGDGRQDAGHGRARHGRRLQPCRPHLRARLRPDHRQRHARAHPREPGRARSLSRAGRFADGRAAARSLGPRGLLRQEPYPAWRHFPRRRRRDRRPARTQRRRPLDDDQGDHGRRSAARLDPLPRRRDRGSEAASDGAEGAGLRP